ncbi:MULTISPECIES: RNase H1/viroplasmin domain-containing protein [Clostridium]|nr:MULTISPECIES: RNase H1/viroplasmin domain-containing protein [Clostridium]MBP8313845.1 RNase H1/viroplasmin domain-containing protein [Clostridium neonatale]MDB2162329.1 RNase H1/viroplasmin domain-containing protein [Clostridium butyricum]CAG9702362.1 Ribonuclease HI [Clostridium neonatale]CAG9702372.1 Ribonuclease HI [Clostridium neonatale]CAG9713751.1 Ribonuclease HI [Clostridium neonatale]
MSKIKYYAIKKGNGVTNKIVETWEECKVLVLGYPAIYKSFKTKDEAMKYLGLKVKEDKPDIEKEETIKKVKKRKGKNQKILKICLENELYEAFIKECQELDMSEDLIIKNMIKEWLC